MEATAAPDHGCPHPSDGIDRPFLPVGEKANEEEEERSRLASSEDSDLEDMVLDREAGGSGAEGESDGDTEGEQDQDMRQTEEHQYKFYILSESQAVAQAGRASNSTAGRAKRGTEGGNGGLKSRYTFVIIGEGSTADAAVESILRMHPEAEILFLSDQKVLTLGNVARTIFYCSTSIPYSSCRTVPPIASQPRLCG